MIALLGSLLALAVIIIFVICFEFRKYQQKVEKDKSGSKDFYRRENEEIHSKIQRCRKPIEPLIRKIRPDSNLLTMTFYDNDTNDPEDVYARNYSLTRLYLENLAIVARDSLEKIEKLETDNIILGFEVKISRMLDSLKGIKNRAKISKTLKGLLDLCRRCKGNELMTFDTLADEILDLELQIEQETQDLNGAMKALEDITIALGYIDDMLKQENTGYVDEAWRSFILSSKAVIKDLSKSANELLIENEHKEIISLVAKVEPLLDQIKIIAVETKSRLDMSKSVPATAG